MNKSDAQKQLDSIRARAMAIYAALAKRNKRGFNKAVLPQHHSQNPKEIAELDSFSFTSACLHAGLRTHDALDIENYVEQQAVKKGKKIITGAIHSYAAPHTLVSQIEITIAALKQFNRASCSNSFQELVDEAERLASKAIIDAVENEPVIISHGQQEQCNGSQTSVRAYGKSRRISGEALNRYVERTKKALKGAGVNPVVRGRKAARGVKPIPSLFLRTDIERVEQGKQGK